MHCSLTITQCTCRACGHSWITSSAHAQHEGNHFGANTPDGKALIANTPPPVPIHHVWDCTITYPRCFRCLTVEELSATHTSPPRPTNPEQDLLNVPEL